MNDFDGKEFLARVREKDYAHAGEEEAIEVVFKNIPLQDNRKILDAGCGRGGTADFVQRHGWGKVVGIDLDARSIEYAKETYTANEFHVCDSCEVGAKFPDTFDLIYLFNAFYAFDDKAAAMKSLRGAAKQGARLCIFDYVWYKPDVALPEVMLSNKPATLEEFGQLLKDAQWELSRSQNLDQKYIEWYSNFLDRFDALAQKDNYSGELIEKVRSKYSDLLSSLQQGIMGGALLVAYAI
jgi:SAM-dependent methyltransferase